MTSTDVRTVLVVDDSRLARMLYRGIIRNVHSNWNIIDASNSKAAKIDHFILTIS